MAFRLADDTLRQLSGMAAAAQRDSRTPALAAGVARRGELLWDAGIGTADLGDPTVVLGPDTQFLIASNTKTFTAVLVMQLRDEGRLGLDDDIALHLPGSAHPGVTIRQLLSHSSGLQREPVGDFWETLAPPDPALLLDNFNAAERIGRPHDRWHYSNLGYMMLGELVARVDGRPWADSLQARLLDPLALARTTLTLQPPCAGRYYVPPFTDVPIEEPVIITGSLAPAGGLASTVADLARWHAFLLAPDAAILHPDTAEEMRQPQMSADEATGDGYGLGLYLLRRDGRVWFGHTGGAPGAITAAFTHAESGTTAVVLTNNSVARDPAATAVGLGAHVLAHDPEPPAPWAPGTMVPEELVALLGVWFSEGSAFTFSVREGELEARMAADPDSVAPSRFAADGQDAYRTVSGRERGERLVVRRRDDGSVAQLNWATYRFTREPLGFGQVNQ